MCTKISPLFRFAPHFSHPQELGHRHRRRKGKRVVPSFRDAYWRDARDHDCRAPPEGRSHADVGGSAGREAPSHGKTVRRAVAAGPGDRAREGARDAADGADARARHACSGSGIDALGRSVPGGSACEAYSH